ncbi:MAG TPA: PaaI family thioesterase [Trueperaceae bacterium]
MDTATLRARFERAVHEARPEFGQFFLARFFDIEVSYGEESCRVDLPVSDYLYNPQGSLHGGVLGFALDVSMGHLCNRFLSTAITLEMKTQYLRPVKGDCYCIATFLKKGRRLAFVESRLFDESGKPAAMATSTWMLLAPESGQGGD